MSKGKTIKDYIQKSKEDWWSCKCGSYHKGFPYKCPVKKVFNDGGIKMVCDTCKKRMSKEDKIIKLLEVQKEMINNCMAYCELNNKIIKEIRKGLK